MRLSDKLDWSTLGGITKQYSPVCHFFISNLMMTGYIWFIYFQKMGMCGGLLVYCI